MRSRRCRIPLGEYGDELWVTLTPRYIHLHLTQPGKFQYTQDIYVPRRSLFKLIQWLIRRSSELPRKGSFYPPDREREYIQNEIETEEELRQFRQANRGRSRRRRKPRK